MINGHIKNGDTCDFKSVHLEKADFVKVGIVKSDIVDGLDFKILLEKKLRNISCLTKSDSIPFQFGNRLIPVTIEQVKPGHAVSTINKNIIVEITTILDPVAFPAYENYKKENSKKMRIPKKKPMENLSGHVPSSTISNPEFVLELSSMEENFSETSFDEPLLFHHVQKMPKEKFSLAKKEEKESVPLFPNEEDNSVSPKIEEKGEPLQTNAVLIEFPGSSCEDATNTNGNKRMTGRKIPTTEEDGEEEHIFSQPHAIVKNYPVDASSPLSDY